MAATALPLNNEPHEISAQNAAIVWKWFRTRGGVLVWPNLDLSSVMVTPSVTTPFRTEEGQPYPKPGWRYADNPRAILDPKLILVIEDREVKRLHVAVRRGDQGLQWKLTDASSRKVREAVKAAGEGAYFEFDYSTQEAVILAPSSVPVPLPDYIHAHPEVLRFN